MLSEFLGKSEKGKLVCLSKCAGESKKWREKDQI